MALRVDKKYVRYANQKAPLVTNWQVDVDANPNMKTSNAKCKILKYTHPRKYKIVFAGNFYKRNKNNTRMIDVIIEHELAHIKHPYTHGIGFRNTAKKLGAPKRYQLPR